MKLNTVDKVSKNLARSITDYFKPVSKSEVLGNGNSSSCERDIKPKNLVTEDKILKALNECDQLVKNSENLKEERKRTDKAKSNNSNQHRSEVAPSTSNNNNNNNHSSSLFERLDSIDRNLT